MCTSPFYESAAREADITYGTLPPQPTEQDQAAGAHSNPLLPLGEREHLFYFVGAVRPETPWYRCAVKSTGVLRHVTLSLTLDVTKNDTCFLRIAGLPCA